MRDLLRSPLPPEVDVLYAAGIFCDLPGGNQDGQILCISNSIHFCYGILNLWDAYVITSHAGATNPRSEIRRLPVTVVDRLRREGHPRLVYVSPEDPAESLPVGRIRKPAVVIHAKTARLAVAA